MDTLLNYFKLKALGRARRGPSVWWVIAASIWMVQRARKRGDVVFRTELKPGEGILVSTRKPSTTTSPDH